METTTTTMLTATVYVGPAGIDYGTFSGVDEAAILDAYAREQGYHSLDHLADVLEQTVEQCRADIRLEYVEPTATQTTTQFDQFHDLAARLADGCVPTTLRFIADMLELDDLPPEAAAVRDGHLPTPAFWGWLNDRRRFGTEPVDYVEVFDRREFEALEDAVAAFARAAGCFGGYAPAAFGDSYDKSRDLPGPDAVLCAARNANVDAQLRHERELEGWAGPDYNQPASLELTDTRPSHEGSANALVRVLWGTGCSLVVLELEYDDEGWAGTWSVGIGVSSNAWAKRPRVNRGCDWATRSPLSSLAKRLAARDLDLTKKGGEEGSSKE